MKAGENHSDESIAYLLGRGDPLSMRIIFDKYYMPLCRYVMRYPIGYNDAEDIVQSVLTALWTNKKGVDFSGSLRSYLYGAVVKASYKFMRESKRAYFEDAETFTDSLFEDLYPESEEGQQGIKQVLGRLVESLPESQRAVLKKIAMDGKPYKEAALDLGVSLNTVKTHYTRALRNLRGKMEGMLPHGKPQ